MRRLFLALALILDGGLLHAQTIADDFNSATLDKSKWNVKQILPEQQIAFPTPGRCGAAAIEIHTRDGDGGLDCDFDCQRAELRVARSALPAYGDEVWYAFSFRIDASVPPVGSAHSVIGQWKAPKDESPFVAQRFDNGVFHITVQDGAIRRVVASAVGDPDAVVQAQQLLAKLDPASRASVSAIQSLQSLYRLQADQPALAARLFSNRLQQGLEGGPADAPASTELSGLLKLPDREIIPLFGEMAYVAEPEKYLGSTNLKIVPEAGRRLPDPRAGWVDMIYRIKGGRTDNEIGPRREGELDIWADGQKIVSVRGNMGAALKQGDPGELIGPYFKFGIYRLRIPGPFHYMLDEFSQAPTRAGLAALCAKP